MAAAAAMTGRLTDVRKLIGGGETTGSSSSSDVTSLKTIDPLEFLTDKILPPPVPEGWKGTLDAGLPASKTGGGGDGGGGDVISRTFTVLKGVAAPLKMENVDTDMIIPKQFLKTIKRTGLKDALFYALRKDPVTGADTDFILNRKPYDEACILVCTGANFGCGSSREHAPWSL